ncbi:hypothetical protein PSPO01_16312 [Paraphaeosphaeria sporulosa]
MSDDRRGGGDRTPDRHRDREDFRDSRNGGRDRANAPESRNHGRDRGGDRGGDRRHDREPPKGPRGAPPGPRRDFNSSGAPRPPPDSRADPTPDADEDVKMEELTQRQQPEGMDDDTWEMAQVVGFARLKSTKNTKVPGNDKNYGVRREKKMEARQYMNRQGGFNRPLSPSRG